MNEVNRFKILKIVINDRLTTSLESKILGLTDATDGVCLHVIASPDRWHWRTAAGVCVLTTSLCLALLNLPWPSLAIITPTCYDACLREAGRTP